MSTRIVSSSPPGPPTGYAHPKCYARSLNDCCRQLSAEHIVSESILRVMGQESDGYLEVAGFSFLGGTTKSLRPKSLKAKVLCRRHNSALSDIDRVGEWVIANPQVPVRIFNGPAFERWMLKALLGGVAAGNWALRDGERAAKVIPEEWVRLLFSQQSPPAHAGLFVTGNERGSVNPPGVHLRVELYGIYDNGTRRLTGLLLQTDIHAFVLSLESQENSRVLDGTWYHRPTRLVYADPGGTVLRDMYFDWGTEAPHSVLEYEVSGIPERDGNSA